ncbi:MAG TPA: metallophosphoesterase [Usitatibacter sp.]|nr:metallophosphoesterase [Usitatibacter sp.]
MPRPARNPFFLLIALLHVYIGVRLLAPVAPWAQALGVAALAACFHWSPRGWRAREGRRPWSVWLPWVMVGFFSWLLVLTVLRDVALAASFFVLDAGEQAVWSRDSAYAVMALAPLITASGFLVARRVGRVRHVEIPIRGLAEALHGFTIAQISDIHVGPTIKRDFVERIVERVNRMGSDMVAITGDVVDGHVHELAHHTEPLAALQSRHGTYVVTGNHEYYSGVHGWVRELRRLGARVLLNEHVVLEHDGASIAVAGVTDYSAHYFDASHRTDPHRALAGAPDDVVKVLLAHQPRSAPMASEAGAHVQLSGHTHGGQFWPWNFFVRLQQPFTAGLHRVGEMWVYINRGTGYWGPPMRFGVPPEITCIRLVRLD